jgi:serine phosphatase RsbU (regulator of sigma subunit)
MPIAFPTDIYLFSDGVFETHRHLDDEPLDRLVDFLVANGQARTVAEIRNRTLEHLKGTPPPDDCSILRVSLS